MRLGWGVLRGFFDGYARWARWFHLAMAVGMTFNFALGVGSPWEAVFWCCMALLSSIEQRREVRLKAERLLRALSD